MRNQILSLLIAAAAIGSTLAKPSTSMEEQIEQDYTRLSGTFRVLSGIIDGKEVPDAVRQQTVLVTDRNKFTVSDRGSAGTSALYH